MLTMTSDDFIQRIDEACEARGITRNKLAALAGISSSSLSLIASGSRNPGPELCRAIAGALKLPPETVLQWAGIIPENLASPDSDEMAYIYANLPPERQAQLREYARFLLDKDEKRDRQATRPNPATR